MSIFFKNEMHDAFGTWPIGYFPYGGADFGEVRAVAHAVGDGDDSAFYNAWMAAGDRLQSQAEAALTQGHIASAKALYLRASVFYGTSFHPLYGAPTDARLLAAFDRQTVAFDAGLSLGNHPVLPVKIPFNGSTLPAYLFGAVGMERQVRPLIIFNNGYDATMTDMYFASAVAATNRGYHALLFDGPGQGAMLYRHGVPLRPDWNVVINAVVDFVETQPIVDPDRIALSGWSLGGFLAPRGASGEPRAAALIADPGTWSIADGFRSLIMRMFDVEPQAMKNIGTLDQTIIDKIDAYIRGNAQLNWKIVKRGFWVHGVNNLRDYFASAELFTMDGHVESIRCPTLITMAENDPLSSAAGSFYDALKCPKALMHFTASEGADGHCEMQNRSLVNQRALDWLNEQLQLDRLQ